MFYLLRCGINQRAGGEIGIAVVLELRAVVVYSAANGHHAARAARATSDTFVSILPLYRCDAGNCILDGDVAALPKICTADASGITAASGGNGAAADGDVATKISL